MQALATALFALTLGLILWRPKGLDISISSTAVALVALASGLVSIHNLVQVWEITWNATLTFIGLIVLSGLLDKAGMFRYAALHVARWAGGSRLRLYLLLMALGALVSGIFANDGGALILTPIVLEVLTLLGYPAAVSLAFVLGIGFVADATSLPFVISNLTNIISADYEGIGFARYAGVMVPVDLGALLAALLVLSWYFRAQLRGRDEQRELPAPKTAIANQVVFRWGLAASALLLIGDFFSSPLHLPVSLITLLLAGLLLAVARKELPKTVGPVLRGAPWNIVLFSLGMYLVVFGLNNAGFTALLSRWLSAHLGSLSSAIFATGLTSAFLSAVFNNLPTVLIGLLAIGKLHAHGLQRRALVYANLVGVDIGPKMTPIGSLATLLWLHVLEKRGLHVGWGRYLATGLVLTIPTLLLTLAVLELRLLL